MARVRRALAAAVAASAILLAFANPVLAECTNFPIARDQRPVVAFAFAATVTNVERGDYVEDPASGLHTWKTTVVVDEVHRGVVPAQIHLRSTDWGCSHLHTGNLVPGDRIFLATERLRPGAYDESDLGHVLAWTWTGDAWAFYEQGLTLGTSEEFYPAAARAATTTTEILRVVSGATMPDTSTGRGEVSAGLPAWVLIGVFLFAFGMVLRRPRSGPRPG